MSRAIQIENHGAVRLISIHRPPANAIELKLAAEMLQALQRAVTDGVSALVLTGHGRFFSAGVDLRVIPRYGPAEQREMVATINHVVQALYEMPVPTVAAVNGHAIGGGMVLALCCDVRIAPETDARLGLTEARAAVPFPAAAMEVVRAELSPAAARMYCLAAENGGPAEARAGGLVDVCVPGQQVLTRALEQAERLSEVPREAYRRVKDQLRRRTCERIDAIVANADDPMLEGWLSSETQTAAAGLLRRRR